MQPSYHDYYRTGVQDAENVFNPKEDVPGFNRLVALLRRRSGLEEMVSRYIARTYLPMASSMVETGSTPTSHAASTAANPSESSPAP